MWYKPFEFVTISVGKKCPNNCSFCYHKASENGYLFDDEISDLEKFLTNSNIKLKKILLAGNDPLLYILTTSKIISISKRINKKVKIEILTNALSLDYFLKRYCKDQNNPTYLAISNSNIGVTIDSRMQPSEEFIKNFEITNIKIENAMFTFSSNNLLTTNEFIVQWVKTLHTNVLRLNLDFISDNRIKDITPLVGKVVELIKYGMENGIYVLGDWDKILTNMIDDKKRYYCGGGVEYLMPKHVFACTYAKEASSYNTSKTSNVNEIYKNLRKDMKKLSLKL